jgi:hypothetical protein
LSSTVSFALTLPFRHNNNNNNNNKRSLTMGGDKGGDSAITTRCGVWEFTLFVLAVLTGTACSICSKTMMELHGPGIDGDDEVFSKPLFQTFGMFVGMLFGLVMHEVVIWCEIPFPGYTHAPTALSSTEKETLMMDGKPSVYGSTMIDETKGLAETRTVSSSNNRAPVWMYFFLAIPSIFDLAATVLCMMGLRYLDVSVYQLLRGSGIIFVAIMKQFVRLSISLRRYYAVDEYSYTTFFYFPTGPQRQALHLPVAGCRLECRGRRVGRSDGYSGVQQGRIYRAWPGTLGCVTGHVGRLCPIAAIRL